MLRWIVVFLSLRIKTFGRIKLATCNIGYLFWFFTRVGANHKPGFTGVNIQVEIRQTAPLNRGSILDEGATTVHNHLRTMVRLSTPTELNIQLIPALQDAIGKNLPASTIHDRTPVVHLFSDCLSRLVLY